MTTVEIINKYRDKINYLDLELLIAHSLGKTREFVLTYPEFTITSKQQSIISKNIKRRMQNEPIAYITGHKEFHGLDFIVNKNTLIPRPETELVVDLALKEFLNLKIKNSNLKILDIGTGSGNIIISIAKAIKNCKLYGIDISKNALKIAKKNAKINGVNKKINFLKGNLLTPPLINNDLARLKSNNLIIVANLPYLSKEIYSSAPNDVKKYEPKSALYSSQAGLAHYYKLLKQINIILKIYPSKTISCIFEISPEQKNLFTKFVQNIFPSARITFIKDLAGKWRVCKIEI